MIVWQARATKTQEWLTFISKQPPPQRIGDKILSPHTQLTTQPPRPWARRGGRGNRPASPPSHTNHNVSHSFLCCRHTPHGSGEKCDILDEGLLDVAGVACSCWSWLQNIRPYASSPQIVWIGAWVLNTNHNNISKAVTDTSISDDEYNLI